MEKSLKLQYRHKLLLYVIFLSSIHHYHQTVIAFQDAPIALNTLQLNATSHSTLKKNNENLPIQDQSDEISNGSYDLVLHSESNLSTSGLPEGLTTSQRHEELAKHTYNVTQTITPSGLSFATSDDKGVVRNKTEGDDLNVSDSRMIAKSVNAERSDEDVGDYVPGEDDVQPQLSDFYNDVSSLDNYADAASSDQIEQKVMKELTKLISKGMAGATDKVKLEKLERWKRRQKERKVMKDNRAKLFEDLLTAAINTHPEEAKKKSKKRTGMKESDGGKTPKSSMPVFGDALQNVDPELAQDAESVLQHLQGISAVFETPSPVESTDEANSSSESDSDDSKTSDGEKGSNKKISLDRPLVRSFKKIKQQFKHRRNQLDQIKKIFNVELAINPKDGSLVGKTSDKKKDYREVGDFNIYDDSTDYPSTSRSGNKKKGSRISKMNELSAYLMENPEILASVMAELTVDSDPSRPSIESSSSSFRANENSPADYSSEQFRTTAASRKLSSLGHHYRGLDNERLSFDYQQNAKNLFSSLGPQNDLDPSEFTLRLGNRYRRHNSNHSLQNSANLYAPNGAYHERTRNATQTISPTETLLLKTLRERQLMNLMRLEMLMAERQQSSSNRSNSYASRSASSASPSSPSSPPATPSPPFGTDEREGESSSPKSSSINSKHQRTLRQQSTIDKKNQTDDEVLHHFMIMNPNTPLKMRQKLIEQQVEQQDQLNYDRQQEANNSQNDSPNRTLSRFKDWRDASSRSSDATPSSSSSMYRQPVERVRGNVTWLPYDLSTGGSTKSIDSTTSKKINDFNKSNIDKSIGVERLSRDYSDFSITRSGLDSISRSQPSLKSMFMTRSSVAHESTTNTPTTKDEQVNQEVSEELFVANDEKARADDTDPEMTKENRDISQDEIEAQIMATDRPKTPMDYFRSYKNEYSSALNERRRGPTKTKTATTTGSARDMKAPTAEELGGMWA